MGSTQREEIIPAPPPYSARATNDVSVDQQQYAPPSFPPPPQLNAQQNIPSSQQHSNDFSTSKSDDKTSIPLAPPQLTQAPPTYEPFSFAEASRSGRGSSIGWHSAPVYHVYHDQHRSTLSFHIALPSTLPPCACGTDFKCDCGRRRPRIWTASNHSKSLFSSRQKIELTRISPNSNEKVTALTAVGSSKAKSFKISNERDYKITELDQMANDRKVFTFVNGQQVSWVRYGTRLELINAQEIPMAILHTNVTPVRLELTAFPWARMPSDELECDFPGCSLKPLYGFVFRCFDCSQSDTFDICEAHLVDECTQHPQNHRFHRLPRPFGVYDDDVYETPLLRMRDLEAQRTSQEIVIMTLACMLLESH